MPRARAPSVSDRVLQVFLNSIDAGGGTRTLMERRQLGWLPDLMRAAYAVVSQEEEHSPPEEIAQRLQTSKESVETLLSAPAEVAAERLAQTSAPDATAREEVAGGLARLGHQRLRQSSPPSR